MTHDYSQYDDNEKVQFNHRAVCNTCDWENRRKNVETIQNSKEGHVRENPDHGVRVEELD